ncbi:MAG: transcription elongation factor GreA [bacterium]|nr:transcription elongation factor GreA [bacterium]
MSNNHHNNSNSSNPILMSQDGIKKIERDLYDLTENKRPDMLRSLQEAREKGDLSENAEYAAAREGLTHIDIQIGKLQRLLSRVVQFDENDIKTDKIGLMSRVRILNLKTEKVLEYRVVAPEEADPRSGSISSTSPVGKALIGKAVGEEFEVEVPAGLVKYRVSEISK